MIQKSEYIMSSILKPELIWVEGRCYRAGDSSVEVFSQQETDLYETGRHIKKNLVDLICY